MTCRLPPFNLSAVPFAPYFPFPKFTPPAAAPLAAGTDGTKNARDVSIGLEELREHLGWAWDGFSGIMSYKSTIYGSRWCIARSLRDLISFAPETVPSWCIDWFYVLFVSQRAVWQMISIALLSPSLMPMVLCPELGQTQRSHEADKPGSSTSRVPAQFGRRLRNS